MYERLFSVIIKANYTSAVNNGMVILGDLDTIKHYTCCQNNFCYQIYSLSNTLTVEQKENV